MTRLIPLLALLPAPAAAAGFERPVPAAQTATTEMWFAIASLALILSLGAVQWLIKNR
ncbi:protein NnrT [Histidinibacterium aquaticum]|uniref:Protein NnrT n=1 Tax=Histidinibacterium aquaticum TaxID=2613962 RepID=A0A5J5GNX4_9RHOB|nr:protein NnrT [Histidinibacterium aquaticum]KAA9010086.1 protein NnrT [Histidinibacterium aquaticum]